MKIAKKKALELKKLYHTSDPFELCDYLKIIVLDQLLPESIKGFYINILKTDFIYLNTSLDENQRKIVLSHELGHAVLHPSLNALFLHQHTLMNRSSLEAEADEFASHILLDDSIFNFNQSGFETLDEISRHTCVPLKYVKIKWNSLKK